MNKSIETKDVIGSSIANLDSEVRTEMLAEYATLRDEALTRMRMRHQILTFAIVILGTILALSTQQNVTPLILLIYPILGVFLAIGWADADVRIGEIGEYIRTKLEPALSGLMWEEYLFKKSPKRFRSKEIHAVGVFLGAELLAVLLAIQSVSFSPEEIILVVSDAIAILVTILMIRRRRRAIR